MRHTVSIQGEPGTANPREPGMYPDDWRWRWACNGCGVQSRLTLYDRVRAWAENHRCGDDNAE